MVISCRDASISHILSLKKWKCFQEHAGLCVCGQELWICTVTWSNRLNQQDKKLVLHKYSLYLTWFISSRIYFSHEKLSYCIQLCNLLASLYLTVFTPAYMSKCCASHLYHIRNCIKSHRGPFYWGRITNMTHPCVCSDTASFFIPGVRGQNDVKMNFFNIVVQKRLDVSMSNFNKILKNKKFDKYKYERRWLSV